MWVELPQHTEKKEKKKQLAKGGTKNDLQGFTRSFHEWQKIQKQKS